MKIFGGGFSADLLENLSIIDICMSLRPAMDHSGAAKYNDAANGTRTDTIRSNDWRNVARDRFPRQMGARSTS